MYFILLQVMGLQDNAMMVGGEQNRIFYHSYPGYQYQKSYTASAQTQDQLNISRVVSKSIIVKAW